MINNTACLTLLLALVLSACSGGSVEEEALLKRLNARELPAWYDAAKLGIFIHWGPYTVPAYAPKELTINAAFLQHYDDAMLYSPYAEWYWNSLQFPESQTSAYHREHFGPGSSYDDFGAQFRKDVQRFDPDVWAEQFQRAGARYVVLTTKHHDGFLLWPSAVTNPHKAQWQSERDLVGELADAVRARGMRFGVYYSGGLDWTFEPRGSRNIGDMVAATPTSAEYARYVEAHFRELIERYQPAVLWNDISYPEGELWPLVQDYYTAVPEGVINDRFTVVGNIAEYVRIGWVKAIVNYFVARLLREHDGDISALTREPPPHYDFATREFSPTTSLQAQKWEATRGIGNSFALNNQETADDLLSDTELLHSFLDVVAKNGNLLLNVAVTSTGDIPPDYSARLESLGQWLADNGGAIYGTRPWLDGAGESAEGKALRFTQKGDRYYVLVLEPYAAGELVLAGIPRIVRAGLLEGEEVIVAQRGEQQVLTLPPVSVNGAAFTIELELQPSSGSKSSL